MTETELKQACVDLSNLWIGVFDVIDDDGIDGILTKLDGIMNLKVALDKTEAIRAYILQRNMQRMLALGISPAELLKMAERPPNKQTLEEIAKEITKVIRRG